ncbi:MAG: four helix bundle protein [Dehalococcoidia bacterium]|nr:four helix bundle protein [Dehalococcoidia bacterium]
MWQKGLDLVDTIYDLATLFPSDERFGLTAQIRRSVISVPNNVAEGQVRGTSRDFANFLSIARGSLAETETLLTIAVRRRFLETEAAAAAFSQMDELGRMLMSLRTRILARRKQSTIHYPLFTNHYSLTTHA